jgi:hypothetical protein
MGRPRLLGLQPGHKTRVSNYTLQMQISGNAEKSKKKAKRGRSLTRATSAI